MIVGSWLRIEKNSFPGNLNKLKKDLTIESNNNGEVELFATYKEDKNYFFVPRSFDKIPYFDAKNKTSRGFYREIKSTIKLRDYQYDYVEKFIKELKSNNGMYGGQIVAPAGSGKTVMNLYLISLLRRTTIIVIHKEFFFNQWRKRIAEFLPDARVGVVQQDRCDFGDDYDILLCSCQSLASRNYPEDFYFWPGVMVFDEVHRYGAKEWSKACVKFPTRLRIGTTATLRRKDGMEPVFLWHIGPVLVDIPREVVPVIKPTIKFTKYNYDWDLKKYIIRGSNKFNFGKWATDVTKIDGRNHMIVEGLIHAIKKGRKIILLSQRREHLNVLNEAILNRMPGLKPSFYVGGMSLEELEEAEKAQLIFATNSMAEEGLDIPKLDFLVLASPIADPEQAVGRIQRPAENKSDCFVWDIVDNVQIASNMARKRRRIYEKLQSNFIE